MKCSFYVFSKKVNSTSVPQVDADWSPEIFLKDNVSLLNPILLLGSPEHVSMIVDYNYCILANKMCYFIDRWDSVREDLWACHCTLDVLGTYKTEILASTQYVEFSQNYGNASLVDGRIAKSTHSTKYVSSAMFKPTFSATGSYSLTVTGEGGSVSTFSLTFSKLSQLLNKLTSWIDDLIPNDDAGDTGLGTLKYICTALKVLTSAGSAPSNIRACYWLPWTYDTIGPDTEIKLGRYPTGITAPKVPNVGAFSTTLNLTGRLGDWRDSSACTRISLFLPYCGIVSIDADAMVGKSKVTVNTGVDYKMGNVSYVISCQDGLSSFDLGSYGGSAGVPMMIGTAVTSPQSAVNSIAAIMAGATIGGAAGGVAGGLASVTNLVNPSITTVGGIGNASASGVQQNAFKLVEEKFLTSVNPSEVASTIGIPTGKILQLANVTGYIKCRNASIAVEAGSSVISQINSYLNGGIYIE